MRISEPRRGFLCLWAWITTLAVGLSLTASPAHARRRPRPRHEIKFATLAPEGSTWLKIMRQLDAELYERTGGELGFKIYPGGVLGEDKDVLRKIRIGQLHAGGFTGVGMGEILPEVRVLDLPFLFFNYDEVDHVIGKMEETFARRFAERGFILLGWAEVGFVHFFSKSPIRTQDDLKTHKVWMWQGDPLAQAYFRALGVSPIPLAVTDVLTSLQTDLVDTVYACPLCAVALQWHTKVSYMWALPMADAAGAVLMSKKAFDRLPPKYQALLKERTREYMRRLVLQTRADNARALEVLRKRGIQVVAAPQNEEMERFVATGHQAQQSLVGRLYSQELLDKVRSAVADFRRLHPEKALTPISVSTKNP
ncbi:MAG: TRAP transporter substrate-binding protein DctP [Nitrospinae bacterium]|nr:TRAP transporter substrate-binding protein DctP [Nitrospinota bacterium]